MLTRHLPMDVTHGSPLDREEGPLTKRVFLRNVISYLVKAVSESAFDLYLLLPKGTKHGSFRSKLFEVLQNKLLLLTQIIRCKNT